LTGSAWRMHFRRLSTAGMIKLFDGELSQAKELLCEASQIYSSHSSTEDYQNSPILVKELSGLQSRNTELLGRIVLHSGDFSKAQDYFTESLHHMECSGRGAPYMQAYSNLYGALILLAQSGEGARREAEDLIVSACDQFCSGATGFEESLAVGLLV